jgi:hypothetical protein
MSISERIAEKVNLNDLPALERQVLTEATYVKKSYFQHLFQQDQIELACEAESLAFQQEIMRLLLERNLISQTIELDQLHEHLSADMKAYGFDDGVNKISTYFYETDAQFMEVYYRFIRHIRNNFIDEAFFFQATPTIRIHCPDGKNSDHYPRYHSDIGYGHPPEEFNLWLPLTPVLSGHGFRTLSVAASADILKSFNYDFPAFIHAAIHDKEFSLHCEALSQANTTPLGKVLAFDSRSIHSGEPLKVHTRASMDIRILPVSRYAKMNIEYQGSGRRKILFAPGHCYHPSDSDYFLSERK